MSHDHVRASVRRCLIRPVIAHGPTAPVTAGSWRPLGQLDIRADSSDWVRIRNNHATSLKYAARSYLMGASSSGLLFLGSCFCVPMLPRLAPA
jgi:hypothetical protein